MAKKADIMTKAQVITTPVNSTAFHKGVLNRMDAFLGVLCDIKIMMDNGRDR